MRLSVAALAAIAIICAVRIAYSACATPGPGISVVGNLLKDSTNKTVVLHGVDRVGSEYMCAQNAGIFDTTINTLNDDVEVPLMKGWTGLNAVQIGIHALCWLGINGVNPSYAGTNYINAIVHEVGTLEANGIWPIISLFYSNPGGTLTSNSSTMPDNEHVPALWRSVANTFKNDHKVIFRLQEEPKPRGNTTDTAAWMCWRNGDVQYDTSNTLVPISTNVNCSETFNSVGYSAVGFQGLVNIIRGTGATNVILLPGVGYSSIFNHFLDAGVRITDTLNPPQLGASSDIYPENSGCPDITCWDSVMVPIINTMPVMVGEMSENSNGFVSNTNLIDAMMAYWDGKGVGYTAWLWTTYAQKLITAYGTGTAAVPWGTDFKAHLATLPP